MSKNKKQKEKNKKNFDKKIKEKDKKISPAKIILLILFDLIFMIEFILTIASIIIALFIISVLTTSFGFTIALISAIALFFQTIPEITNISLSILFLGAGIFFGGLLSILISYKIGKVFIKLNKKYFKFHEKIFGGEKNE